MPTPLPTRFRVALLSGAIVLVVAIGGAPAEPEVVPTADLTVLADGGETDDKTWD